MTKFDTKKLAILKDRVINLFLTSKLPLEAEKRNELYEKIKKIEFSSIEVYFDLVKILREKHSVNLDAYIDIHDLPEHSQFVGTYEKMQTKKSVEKVTNPDPPKKKQNPFAIFSHKVQAEDFQTHQPMFYDYAQLFWRWDFELNCWVKTDEIDILNKIESATGIDIISPSWRAKILNLLKQSGRKSIPKISGKNFIQFKNGLIDIRKPDEITLPSPKYFITNPIPHNIGDSEETPIMDKLFEEWVGKDYVQTLYEIIAYCLYPDYPIERIFCLIGAGSNGKSCFLNLLRNFIGEQNVTSTDLNLLIKNNFQGSKLYKKLVCLMGETDFNVMERTEKIKRLVSGKDPVSIEFKNKQPFDTINYAKLLIATNSLPTTTDKTVGFYRRWTLIDFPNQFNEEKDILGGIPEKEYENLAKKSIRILVELLKKRIFTNDGNFEERAKRFEERSNPFEKFWKEEIDEDFNEHIFKWDFKKEFDSWCEENRFRKLTERTVSNLMKDKGIEASRVQADWYSQDHSKPRWNAWIGIKWKKKAKNRIPVKELRNSAVTKDPETIKIE